MNDLGETRFTSTKYKLRNSSNLHAQVGKHDNGGCSNESDNVSIRNCVIS